MPGEPLRHTLKLANPSGLHLRPIGAFVEEARKYQSDVTVRKDSAEPVNGKNAFAMLTLVAEQGCELTVEVSGPDAAAALAALAEVLERISSGEFEIEKA